MVEAAFDSGQLAPEPTASTPTTSQLAQGLASPTRGSSLGRVLEGVTARWLPAADQPAAGVGEVGVYNNKQVWKQGGLVARLQLQMWKQQGTDYKKGVLASWAVCATAHWSVHPPKKERGLIHLASQLTAGHFRDLLPFSLRSQSKQICNSCETV